MKKFLILIVLLHCFFSLNAEIIECHQFSDIKPLLCPLDVIFTEIDEVLVTSTETIASIPFLNHLKQNSLYEGLSLNQTTTHLNVLWSKILQKAHFELKEKYLPEVFKELQKDQISIFGFTARPSSCQATTLKLLQQNKLYFNSFNTLAENNFLRTALSNGLLFASFEQRFEILDSLFKGNFFNSSRVVFVDYNLMNLVQTQLFFEEKGISFLGIYFPINNLNRDDYAIQIGSLQLKYLHTILPNSVVKSLIQHD